jgi:hypothetical protein
MWGEIWRCHLADLDIDGRIILKWILVTFVEVKCVYNWKYIG